MLYSDATMDPYNHNYWAVMHTSRDRNAPLSGNDLWEAACSVVIDVPIAYQGFFTVPAKECRQSLLMHGWKTYLPLLGCPTPWDGNTYAFIQDVVDGDITQVSLFGPK